MTQNMKVELLVIGGGPAGMAAAISAYEKGIRDILILERDVALGGILRQCIHNGFGLHRFGEELTGPEYASRYARRVEELAIPVMTETMVVSMSSDKTVCAMNKSRGIFNIEASAIVLAMGCRERPKGALNIAGTRPAGIYTAGTAQKFVNMRGLLPGKRVVILGSGDIGLIMARRMTLEGAKVECVCELMPYSGGLARNIEQCLNDFNIPLKLSHTVVDIHGKDRVSGVTVCRVDENLKPIPESAEYIECDTLLLSCGLIPENELTEEAGIRLDKATSGAIVDDRRETSVEGVFAAGNVLHVHDLVDFVSEEAALARAFAAEYIKGNGKKVCEVRITAGAGVRYTVPQHITSGEDTEVYFRVRDTYKDKRIVVRAADKVLLSKKTISLAPAEMEKIKILAKYLSDGDITVSVE